jgi:ABC-type dipeptide/oligopeptide/nickel transport system permease component
MAMVLIVSTTVVLGNLVADLAYRWADPRIRY